MGMRADIHNYERILESTLSKLGRSNINEANKKIIKRFARYLMTEGLSCGRVAKYVMQTRKLAHSATYIKYLKDGKKNKLRP
jgi:hypothetical protein